MKNRNVPICCFLTKGLSLAKRVDKFFFLAYRLPRYLPSLLTLLERTIVVAENVKPRTDEQFFLDKFYLLVCTTKNWQVFLDKEPSWKAGHASFSTRKLVRVYSHQGKIVRRTHERINLSRNLSRKNCSSVRGFRLQKRTAMTEQLCWTFMTRLFNFVNIVIVTALWQCCYHSLTVQQRAKGGRVQYNIVECGQLILLEHITILNNNKMFILARNDILTVT